MINSRPLSNICVIDFGQYLAAPAVAMTLADLGAEVIRVDPPGGPKWQNPATDMLNRGKKSIVLDLKQADELEMAKELIATADVVIENFRPGVMARLGLGAPAMLALNPRLVYLSLPGFASTDEKRRDWQAWEGVIAAAMGQFTDMGLNRVLMGINPSFTPLTLASAYGTTLGLMGVLLALREREQSGQGDMIEVPLATALLEGLVYNAMGVETYPTRYKSRREREMDRRVAAGESFDMGFAQLQEYLDPFYRHYMCADGRMFYLVCASHLGHCIRCLKLLGLWDEFEAAGIPTHDVYMPSAEWPNGETCSLGGYPLSAEWAERVSAKLKAVFATKSAFEWEEIFGQAGIPGAAHRTSKEWLNSEHALTSGLVAQVDDPRHGIMHQMGSVAWLESDAQAIVQKMPAPTLDADRDEILATLESIDLSSPPPTKSDLLASPDIDAVLPRWLEGVKIVDLTNVIAGPTIASTLARFGADVTLVSPVKPTFDPWNTIIFGLQANRGKRSLLLDIKSDEGRKILSALLADADVLVFNGLIRQLEPLGIDWPTLQTINPNLILCHLDGCGGPLEGPRTNYPAYDDLVQASTGVMVRFGGGMDTPEEHAHLGTIDVLAGFCTAVAACLALFKRERGGGADIARASLATGGQLIQMPFMYDFDGRPPFSEPAGREVKGWGALYHCYEAADGWFFLATTAERQADLGHIPELAGCGDVNEEDLHDWLAKRFKSQPVAYWVEKIQAQNMGATPIESLVGLRERYLVAEDSPDVDLFGQTLTFLRHANHPSGRTIDLIAPNAIRPTRGQITIPSAAVKYGAHTRTILAELGYSSAEIEHLLAQGVVAESWSREYLPS